MTMLMRPRGSSLIEVLIVIGIIGIICSAALPHFDSRRQDVNTAMRTLIGEFRTARTQALTKGTHFAVHMPAPGKLMVERMEQATDGTWQVATVTQKMALPAHLNFWMTPDRIEFNTRGTMITSTSPLYIYVSDQFRSGVRAFSVWPSGQVHEEY
jgi:prepilin-type N-terminal cleavage/methylation domain-containing protein